MPKSSASLFCTSEAKEWRWKRLSGLPDNTPRPIRMRVPGSLYCRLRLLFCFGNVSVYRVTSQENISTGRRFWLSIPGRSPLPRPLLIGGDPSQRGPLGFWKHLLHRGYIRRGPVSICNSCKPVELSLCSTSTCRNTGVETFLWFSNQKRVLQTQSMEPRMTLITACISFNVDTNPKS